MFSQRGVMHLAHTVHDLQEVSRRSHANRLNGVDSEFLTTAQVKEEEPLLNTSKNTRYPILGASIQRRAGTARHDAVAWGYARGADARGVDIIQNCEVTGILIEQGRVTGVETTRGRINCGKLAVVAAGHSSVIADMAGFRLPIESFPLQALVSEPVKPCVNTVIMSNAVHGYISQSDKGELVIGAGTDQYVTSYSQRGGFPRFSNTRWRPFLELFPILFAHAHASDNGAASSTSRLIARPIHRPRRRCAGIYHQLWLGYRRLQGDPGVGPCFCPHHRHGTTPHHDQRALCPRPLYERRISGRAQRRRRCPLVECRLFGLQVLAASGRRLRLTCRPTKKSISNPGRFCRCF